MYENHPVFGRALEIVSAAMLPAAEKVAEKASAATNPSNANSFLDFVSPLLSSIGINDVKDADGNFNLTKNWTNGRVDVQLSGTLFAEPEIFESLQEQIPAAEREAVVADLNSDVGQFDMFDAKLAVNFTKRNGRRWGRDAKQYDDVLCRLMIGLLEERFKSAGQEGWVKDWLGYPVVAHAKQVVSAAQTKEFLDLAIQDLVEILGEEKVGILEQHLLAAFFGEGDGEANGGASKAVQKLKDRFADLVANQPQAFVEGLFKHRQELTGPDELSGQACYEIGVAGNVNDFLRFAKNHGPEGRVAKRDMAASSDATESCKDGATYHCFQAWEQANGTPRSQPGEQAQRLAIAVEYKETDAFMAPLDVANFMVAEDQTYSASLTYGRFLRGFSFLDFVQGGREDGTRLELEARWDEVDPDSSGMMDMMAMSGAKMEDMVMMERVSRLVTTLTFTQTLTDKTALSLSLVYANKPEFLGEVDHDISANLGFRVRRQPRD